MEPLRMEIQDSSKSIIRRKPVASLPNAQYVAIQLHEPHDQQTSTSDERNMRGSRPAEAAMETASPSAGTRNNNRHQRTWSQAWLWLPECLWCIASLGLLGAIIAVLAWRNNKPLPSWYADITVNTVIALLATICRAATIVPISEGLSQLKWIWFAQGTRPLRDIGVFEKASRGPWGSLQLLLISRGQYVIAKVQRSP
ncbi:hypothetical protein CC79DRAFT_1144090 [Sarocladium strictum]